MKTSIDKMIERFSFHIREIAAPLFERNIVGNKSQINRNAKYNRKWFDGE